MKSRRRSSNTVSTIPNTTRPMYPVSTNESSFGSAIKQGFGWGLGTSLAHRLIASVSHTPVVSDPVSTSPIDSTHHTYKQCMAEFEDEAACKQYLK